MIDDVIAINWRQLTCFLALIKRMHGSEMLC